MKKIIIIISLCFIATLSNSQVLDEKIKMYRIDASGSSHSLTIPSSFYIMTTEYLITKDPLLDWLTVRSYTATDALMVNIIDNDDISYLEKFNVNVTSDSVMYATFKSKLESIYGASNVIEQ